MKNPFHIITVVCFLLISFVVEAQAGAPEAMLPEAQHRFGTAIEGDIVRHDFILLNRGNADLKIEK
jgi:hypothetical protein